MLAGADVIMCPATRAMRRCNRLKNPTSTRLTPRAKFRCRLRDGTKPKAWKYGHEQIYESWSRSGWLRRGVCRGLAPCIHPPVVDLGAGWASRIRDVRMGRLHALSHGVYRPGVDPHRIRTLLSAPLRKILAGVIRCRVGDCDYWPYWIVAERPNSTRDDAVPVGLLGEFGFLRAMGAPLPVMSLLTFSAFAPPRRPRWALLVATGLEFTASVYFICRLLLAGGRSLWPIVIGSVRQRAFQGRCPPSF